MAKELNIVLPKSLKDLPEKDRQEILARIQEALKLPGTWSVPRSTNDEHNIWERNHDDLVADAEDQFYTMLVEAEAEALARLMDGLGLPTLGDLSKSFTDEFLAWENDYLEKGRGKVKISELVNRNRKKREQFIQWIRDAKALTKEQLQRVDNTLKEKLPKYAEKVEAFMVRGGYLGKIRNEAERENYATVGAYIDRVPETIQAATKEHIVLTQREKHKEPTKRDILPLTPQEVAAVEHATHSAADKVTEISEKHRAKVRQLVMLAKKERWTANQLAMKLYDTFAEHNRDWRRVAITELSFVVNDAYLSGLEEGARVIGMGSVNACKHCKKYVIGKEFTVIHTLPKHDTYETDMEQVWVGKTNYGRRVQEYRACIPMHPNCRCRWHRLSSFYKAGPDGKVVRKTTNELIQEERAKRGLPPDPNLT